MSLQLSRFNLKTTFDNNLRDVPDNTHEMGLACQAIEDYLKIENSPLTRATWLGTLGSFQRILKLLTPAELSHQECLQILLKNSADQRRIYAAHLRLAHVYQWQERFTESNQLFSETVMNVQKLEEPILLSFCYQHQGKNFFDQKRYSEALNCFKLALEIRELSGDLELIESSRLAVNKALSRVSN